MKKTILSLEQALTLPYTTQRFAQLGWRVIRIESPPNPKTGRGGDPNRYIGEDTGADDRHAYYVAPNIGKEAITLNLKKQEGQDLLKKLIKDLNVDLFLCNTLPKRYKQLGIDYETLKESNPDLIWCGISALGPDYPGFAGYDPALQAFTGYMFLTGDPDRDPMLCGLPIIDLKAGDEAFAQVLLALLEQQENAINGKQPGGKEIFISMVQCAASWLITALPQLEFVEDKSDLFTRSGNEHRSFIPCNCYPTKDGYVYLAIGNDFQWDKLTKIKGFEHCEKSDRITNQGRLEDKNTIYADIRTGLENYTTDEFMKICSENNLAASPVNSVQDVAELDFIKKNMLRTQLPSGKEVSLFPVPSDTDFLNENNNMMKCAPGLGEHNDVIMKEIGFGVDDIQKLKDDDII
ncbi:MAG: CoA transferase [Candidatus Electryonea clarkiae]|nr:CoA transferase [Candidatus Electryonea clarkiae]MDP8286109.1 CoA transferase [Candidatus Electryonea clarkiae]